MVEAGGMGLLAVVVAGAGSVVTPADATLTGTFNFWPALICVVFRSLSSWMFLTVVLYLPAILMRLSPGLTT